jgi:hypothetical protein
MDSGSNPSIHVEHAETAVLFYFVLLAMSGWSLADWSVAMSGDWSVATLADCSAASGGDVGGLVGGITAIVRILHWGTYRHSQSRVMSRVTTFWKLKRMTHDTSYG